MKNPRVHKSERSPLKFEPWSIVERLCCCRREKNVKRQRKSVYESKEVKEKGGVNERRKKKKRKRINLVADEVKERRKRGSYQRNSFKTFCIETALKLNVNPSRRPVQRVVILSTEFLVTERS